MDAVDNQKPSAGTMPPYERTNGAAAGELASAYGLTPDPWQQLLLDHILGRDKNGRWTASRVGYTLPRQNGKNAVIEMVELYQAAVLGRRILHTAHEVKTSRTAFTRIASFFENPKFPELRALLSSVRRTNGQEAVVLNNGGSIEFSARTSGAGRGFTVDTLVMDEAQDLSSEQLAALLPTISASPSGNPQQIVTGTPPTTASNSEVWEKLRDSGLRGKAKRQMWAEWGAQLDPGDIDVNDQTLWYAANPALGRRLSTAVVEDEAGSLDEKVFMRERLGMWSTISTTTMIPADSWQRCQDKELRLDPKQVDDIFIAVDVTPARDSTALVACVTTTDGRAPIIDVIEKRSGPPDWVPARLESLVSERPVSAILIDGYSPAASLIPLIQQRGLGVTRVAVEYIATAAEMFVDAVTGEALRHMGQPEMLAAVVGAKKRRVGDRFAFARGSSEVDITPLVAASLAFRAVTYEDIAPLNYRPQRKKRRGPRTNYTRKVMVM